MAALAYSPKFYLLDSRVAVYKIYILKNPFTNEVFYVGQTMKEPEERLTGHLAESESNKEKQQYIQRIIEQGGKPVIEVIETINGTCYIDKITTNEREIHWIKHYKSIGCSLLNIAATKPNQKCQEYHNYLSSIKQGQSKYHYYYCGKTVGGMDVYDEDRLMADGFRLPQPIIETVRYEPDPYYYNPWDNQRFLDKNNIKSSTDWLFYDTSVYRDTDPNYYNDDY